jgi:class 3 adenylate cyclase
MDLSLFIKAGFVFVGVQRFVLSKKRYGRKSKVNNSFYRKVLKKTDSNRVVSFADPCKNNLIDKFSNYTYINYNYAVTTHHDVCIFIMDIANFTQWCAKKEPIDIFKTMTEFNKLINRKIALFQTTEKVELVGDSMLIVGGLYNESTDENRVLYTTETLRLAMMILQDVQMIRDSIFRDENISIRIGIHNGNVYSGYIKDPHRYQLFGNSINIASRLESSCSNGCMNISQHTYDIVQNNSTLLSNVRLVEKVTRPLKGVGDFESMVFELNNKRNSFELASTLFTPSSPISQHSGSSESSSLTESVPEEKPVKNIDREFYINLLLIFLILF